VAEIALIDPEASVVVDGARLRSKSRNTPWLGKTLTGEVRMTLAGGRIVFEA
jgi:dihydroorotase